MEPRVLGAGFSTDGRKSQLRQELAGSLPLASQAVL